MVPCKQRFNLFLPKYKYKGPPSGQITFMIQYLEPLFIARTSSGQKRGFQRRALVITFAFLIYFHEIKIQLIFYSRNDNLKFCESEVRKK